VRQRITAVAVLAAVILLFLIVVVFKSGVWPVPNLRPQYDVSQHLTHSPTSGYFHTSYLQPAVFGVLGGKTIEAYVVYCGLLTLVFLIALIATFIHIHGWTWKLAGLLVFSVAMVPVYWIGMDGATLLLMLAVLTTFDRTWVWLFAMLLSWQHLEQAVLGFGILALTFLLSGRGVEFRRTSHILATLLAGRILLVVYLHFVGVHVTSDRTIFAVGHLRQFAAMWYSGWPWTLWSLCGVGWFLLLTRLRLTWPIFVVTPLVLLVLIAVTDHTRVGVIVLFPTLAYWAFLNPEFWREMRPAWIATAVVAYLLVPVVYVWGGLSCGSVFDHTVAQLRFRPSVSRWTMLDYYWPFVDGVCPRSSDIQ
jgi:hypothetical protein